MREYIDVTAPTEDEAIRKGLEQLGKEREDVSVEVLERAKKGFLGIGSAPAKVRLSYGEEEPVPVPEPEKPEPEPEKTEKRKPDRKAARNENRDKPKNEKKNENRKPKENRKPDRGPDREGTPEPEKQPRTAEKPPRPEKGEKGGRKENRKRPEPKAPEKRAEKPEAVPATAPGQEIDDEKAQAIKSFLTGLLQHMGTPADVKVSLAEGGRYRVLLEGQGMGGLIGRRGETLDAIQQITSYAVNRTGNRVRIQLDAEGYREKREQSLRHLARKTAAKVVKSRRSFTLEPMNAYERHVIHTALQDYAGITTYSTGVDPNRRVIVACDRENG